MPEKELYKGMWEYCNTSSCKYSDRCTLYTQDSNKAIAEHHVCYEPKKEKDKDEPSS